MDPFFTNIVDVYDADTNIGVSHAYERKASLYPSVIFKNKLYVAGGSRGLYDELQDPYSIRPFEELEYSNSVEVYDLATNTWEPWIIDNVTPHMVCDDINYQTTGLVYVCNSFNCIK